MKFRLLPALILISLFCSQAHAGEDTEIFDMTLDQLLRVKVVSKEEENINLTPGIVSVYYPEQLQQMGMHSLPEFLRFATSVEFNYAISGVNPLQVRGLSDANNQKILFLVDGVPYWMPSHGDIPTSAIPLAMIERIEIVRGPASVVYGTNSSSGVINLVTKHQVKSQLNIYATSEGATTASLYHSHNFTDAILDFAIESRIDDGFDSLIENSLGAFDPSCLCFPQAAPGTINKQTEHAALYAKYQSGGLKLSLQQFQESVSSLASGTLLSPAEQKQFGTLVAFHYQRDWDDNHLNIYSDWNRFYWRRDIEGILAFNGIPGDGKITFDENGKDNYRWRSGITYEYNFDEFNSLLLGIENETRSTGDNKFQDNDNGATLTIVTQPPFNLPFQIQPDGSILLIDAEKLNETALLAQYDYRSKNWRLVSGFRYVDNEFSGTHLSPRLSYIYSLDNQYSLKALYSEGFNSPTFRQITARNSFGIPQSVDVSAEIVKTTELAITKKSNNASQTFNLFYTRGIDLIQSNFSGVTNSQDVIKRSGAEYELRYKTDSFDLMSSLSYLKQGNQIIANDTNSIVSSKWLLKVGGIWKVNQHQFGVSLKAASKRANVDEYYLIDSSYQYQSNNWRWFLSLNNALDEDIQFPDVRNQESVIFHAHPGRHLTAGFTYNF